MENIKQLKQNEILNLEDDDLQLRYFLGSFNTLEKETCRYNNYWWCIAHCTCAPVPQDERFDKVKLFIQKHNISNGTFIRLLTSRNFNDYFKSYNGNYGEFVNELDNIINEYKIQSFSQSNLKDNDRSILTEQQLLDFISKQYIIKDSLLNKFLSYYQLTLTDFMVLAKTRKFVVLRYDKRERQDLLFDLFIILKELELELEQSKLEKMKKDVSKIKKMSILK